MGFSDERNLVFVSNPVLSQPILDYLRNAGIDATASEDDDLGGLDPALTFVHGSYVLVPTDQIEEAKRLVAEFEAAPVVQDAELADDDTGTSPL